MGEKTEGIPSWPAKLVDMPDLGKRPVEHRREYMPEL
jgi:hypothetical protein